MSRGRRGQAASRQGQAGSQSRRGKQGRAESGGRAGTPSERHEQAQAAERIAGRRYGLAGYLATALFFAALIVSVAAVQPDARSGARPDDRGSQLVAFDDSRGTALLSTVLGALGLVLVLLLGAFLFRALRRRVPETPRHLLTLGLVAPLALAIGNLLGWVSLSDVASTFTDSGVQTSERAKALMDDSGLYRATQVIQIVCAIAFGAWLALLCNGALRAGLLPRFLAYWGYGVAVMIVLMPFAGQALLVGWVASVAMVAADHWPGGRPPAWAAGRAIPPEEQDALAASA